MITYELNGKTYSVKELDFDDVCELESAGVSIMDFKKKPMSVVRAFVSLSVGDLDLAGKEISEHVKNGGTFDDIMKAFSQALEESGFFQALNETQANQKQKSQTKKRASSVKE